MNRRGTGRLHACLQAFLVLSTGCVSSKWGQLLFVYHLTFLSPHLGVYLSYTHTQTHTHIYIYIYGRYMRIYFYIYGLHRRIYMHMAFIWVYTYIYIYIYNEWCVCIVCMYHIYASTYIHDFCWMLFCTITIHWEMALRKFIKVKNNCYALMLGF